MKLTQYYSQFKNALPIRPQSFLSSLPLFLLALNLSACGKFSAAPISSKTSGSSVLPPIDNENPPPTTGNPPPVAPAVLKISKFESSATSIVAGQKLTFKVTLNFSGTTALTDGKQAFVHFVSASQPDWFEFHVYPLSGPKSSLWMGDTVMTGEVTIPTSSLGTYSIQVGVNDASSTAESKNMKLGPSSFTETFTSGAIGYRYKVATLQVTAPVVVEPPPPPPPPPPTGSVNSLQAILDDMQLDGEYPTKDNGNSRINVSTTETLRAVSRPGRPVNFAETVTSMTPWFWVWPNPNSKSSNTAVEVRSGGCYILRKNNVWQRIGGGYLKGVEQDTDYNTKLVSSASGWDEGKGHTYTENGTVLRVKPVWLGPRTVSNGEVHNFARTYELWIREKMCGLDQPFGSDLKAIYATVQARLVLIDPSGVDDRAQANFTAQLGFDFWAPQSWHATTMKEDANGNPIPQDGPWKPGYPAMQMDGGQGRFKYIRNEWRSFNVISVETKYTSYFYEPYYRPTYDRVPDVLSNAEFFLNPPPLN